MIFALTAAYLFVVFSVTLAETVNYEIEDDGFENYQDTVKLKDSIDFRNFGNDYFDVNRDLRTLMPPFQVDSLRRTAIVKSKRDLSDTRDSETKESCVTDSSCWRKTAPKLSVDNYCASPDNKVNEGELLDDSTPVIANGNYGNCRTPQNKVRRSHCFDGFLDKNQPKAPKTVTSSVDNSLNSVSNLGKPFSKYWKLSMVKRKTGFNPAAQDKVRNIRDCRRHGRRPRTINIHICERGTDSDSEACIKPNAGCTTKCTTPCTTKTQKPCTTPCPVVCTTKTQKPCTTKCPVICTTKCPTVCTTKCPTVCTTKCPTVCTSKCPTVCTSKCPTCCTSKCPTVCTSKCPTVCTSKCPTVCTSKCPKPPPTSKCPTCCTSKCPKMTTSRDFSDLSSSLSLGATSKTPSRMCTALLLFKGKKPTAKCTKPSAIKTLTIFTTTTEEEMPTATYTTSDEEMY